MAGGREFSSGKFKELILLFAERSAADPVMRSRMSRVKLNKLLYLADFEAFRLLGHSITGATYVRGEHGPMAYELPLAEDELGRGGLLSWRVEQLADGVSQKVPVAEQAADPSVFESDELPIIEYALKELAEHGGKAAADWSHDDSVGWRLAKEDLERIPYETSIIASEPAPAKTVARLRDRVLSGNWE
jgi:hypothetical protein